MGQHRSPLRLLAPVALVAFGLTLLVIVAGSASTTPERTGTDVTAGARTTGDSARQTTTTRERRAGRRSYTVRSGDTLGAIAEETGLSVQALQDLNPELDPQALVSGQKLKLRE